MDQIVLIFFSTLGAFNGLLLAMYFFFIAKPRQLHNYLLGGLLAVMSIRVGKSVILYFIPETKYIDIYLQIGLTACFFIGPLLILYIYYFVSEKAHSWVWKSVLSAIVVISLVFGLAFPLWKYDDLWLDKIIWVIYAEWSTCIVISFLLLYKKHSLIFIKQNGWKNKNNWLLSIFWGNVIVWLAYILYGLTSYIMGALLFSFLLYLLIFLLLTSSQDRKSILFKDFKKYGGRVFDLQKTESYLNHIKVLFEEDEIFKDPKLKASDVAAKLNTTPHLFSQFINDELGKNFSEFVNHHRIEKAKSLIQTEDNLSLEGIGYECGFKAKSTFYSVFKKHVGHTPAQFKKLSIPK